MPWRAWARGSAERTVLALAGVNLSGAAAFAAIYAAAGARWLTQGAFAAALVCVFVGLTAVWLRVERRGGFHRDALGRLGRVAAALVMTVAAVPGIVLMPLFAVRETLPPEAGFDPVIRAVMVLLLISLALTAAMNAVGGALIVGAGMLHRLKPDQRPR